MQNIFFLLSMLLLFTKWIRRKYEENEEKNMGIGCQFPVLIIYVEQVNKNMLIY